MANHILLGRALARAAADGVGRTFDELIPSYRSRELKGPRYDSDCTALRPACSCCMQAPS